MVNTKINWLYPLQPKKKKLYKISKNKTGADCGSDHELLIAKFRLKLKKAGKTTRPFNSVQFSHSVVSDSLRPHESQHARPPCPSPTPRVYSNSCPSSRWCHPAISSSVIPFSSCPQSLPSSESFPVSQLFAWGGQGTGVSALASFLPKKSQGWSPSEWTVWISLQSKVGHNKLWKILGDRNARPPYLSPEKPVCRSRSKVRTNELVQNWERSLARL